MRILFLIFILISFQSFSQFRDTTIKNRDVITDKMLYYIQYHPPIKTSPSFKVTCRTSANKNAIMQFIQDPEAFDGIQMSQLGNYNLRVRWRFKNYNRIFIGTETMTVGKNVNIYYLGLRKQF